MVLKIFLNISEETRNPTRIIPKGATDFNTNNFHNLSFSLYLKHFLVGWKELSSSEAPLAVVLAKTFGILWYYFAYRYCIICYNKYRSNDACIRI